MTDNLLTQVSQFTGTIRYDDTNTYLTVDDPAIAGPLLLAIDKPPYDIITPEDYAAATDYLQENEFQDGAHIRVVGIYDPAQYGNVIIMHEPPQSAD